MKSASMQRKKLLRFGFGVFGEWSEKCRFCLFGYSFMTSSPVQWVNIVAQSLVGF